MQAFLAFLTALPSFFKALPDIMKLINDLKNGVSVWQENQNMKREVEDLRAAIKKAVEEHDNTALNNLFNGS